MIRRISWWCVVAIVGIPLLAGPVLGQDVEDRDQWAGGDGLWSNDDNWVDNNGEPSGAPSPVDLDRWALVNSGNVTVDEDISTSGLTVNGGTVHIAEDASLTIDIVDDAFSVGQTEIGNNGAIAVGGTLKGLDFNNRGHIWVGWWHTGPGPFPGPFPPNPCLSCPPPLLGEAEFSGDFSSTGELGVVFGSDGNSSVKVGGDATIGGTVMPVFANVDPKFGDSFEFLSDAKSVSLKKPVVELPQGGLGRGLNARVESAGGSASIVIGNLPILQVDRASGAASLTNVVGDAITMTGYSITSDRGLLNGAEFTGTGTEGFITPNANNASAAEFSLEGVQTISVGQTVDIGNAYNGGATHPDDEDVSFQFSTESGDIIDGLVEYLGPVNDIVLNANPETGEVTLYHLSSHLASVDITGYTLTSASGSLNADNWVSFVDSGAAGDGWTEGNPNGDHLSELNLSSSSTLANGTAISLGNIYGGTPDLRLQYATDSEIFDATITYGTVPVPDGCQPVNSLLGDLDGDGTVAFADFLVLSTNFNQAVSRYEDGDINCDGTVAFADFLVLSTNFNKSLGATAAAVPEPNSSSILVLGGLLTLAIRRRRSGKVAMSASSTNPAERHPITKWKHALVALTVIVASITTTTTQQVKADILGYWPFEDGEGTTVADQSGNDFHAEAMGDFAFTDDGFQGGAGDFGAFNNGAFVLLPPEFSEGDDGFNKIVDSQNFTISYWLKDQDGAATSQWTFLFGGSRQIGSHAPWGDGNIYFDVAGCCGGNQRISTSLGAAATDGEWHHLAYVKRKEEGADLAATAVYLDGSVIVSSVGWDDGGDPPISDVVAIDAASIGADNGGGSSHEGLIDEFCIWDEALSLDRIAGLADGAPCVGENGPDFNMDGVVNIDDFTILAANIGDRFAFGESADKGDVNGDLRVDLKDFLAFRDVFNAQGAAAAAVPEPNSILLLSLALIGISFRRRSRR